MRRICAEAEGRLKTAARPVVTAPPSLAGFVKPITEATVDAACLVARRLDAPLLGAHPRSGP
jgi:hypothetical protein